MLLLLLGVLVVESWEVVGNLGLRLGKLRIVWRLGKRCW